MELVVLLDEHGSAVGTALKEEVHTTSTPLHLAFSCHVVDDDGRILVTRRALTKRTWPGVWTNSFCGHPQPDEEMTEAVARRAEHELGVGLTDLRLALPGFRYRAIDSAGIVENEVCPVHVARTTAALQPDPTEVAEFAWVRRDDLLTAVQSAPFAFSPWLREQLPLLIEAGAV